MIAIPIIKMEKSSVARAGILSAEDVRRRLEPFAYGAATDGSTHIPTEDVLCEANLDDRERDPFSGTELFFCPIRVAEAYQQFIRRYGDAYCDGYSVSQFELKYTNDQAVMNGYRACASFIGNGNSDTVARLNASIITVFFDQNELNMADFIDPDKVAEFRGWWNVVPYLQLLGLLTA